MSISWLNPKLLPFVTNNHRLLMRSTFPEVCLSGPTRTSKTIQCLIKLFSLAFKYPKFKARIVRLYDTDLTDTIRSDIRNTLFRYHLEDKRCPVRVVKGGPTEFTHLVVPSTNSEIILGGMKRPRNVLGSDADMIFYSQAEESVESQHQILKTRCVGTAGNWVPRGNRNKPRFQLLMDCNPDEPDHYLKQREQDGLLEMIDFTFQDNPLFYPDGVNASAVGQAAVDELDRSLVGIYHDRYFKGLWVSPRGRVFELKPCHFLQELPEGFDIDYMHYNAIDFGMASPSVCLFISEHRETKDYIIWKDYRRTHTDIIEFGHGVRRHREGVRVINTIIDNDEEKQKLLLTHCGIPTELARKGPGSIQDGVHLMQNDLKKTERGESGGVRFFVGLRDSSDAELVRKKKPLDVIQESKLYHYPNVDGVSRAVTVNDLPVKGNDHGIDCWRYWSLWRVARQRAFGFFTGRAKRKRL